MSPTLKSCFSSKLIEAGCDEAGRGCLAGPVVAAAVILPKDYFHPLLNDSKQLSIKQRLLLRTVIEKEAIDCAIGEVNNEEIDQINILHASFLAMHRAIDQLKQKPELLLIDGNRFQPYEDIQHQCIVKGDAKFCPIAAASVMAKTHRDALMHQLAEKFPGYFWKNNVGYPTKAHREAIQRLGVTPYHRKTFRLTSANSYRT